MKLRIALQTQAFAQLNRIALPIGRHTTGVLTRKLKNVAATLAMRTQFALKTPPIAQTKQTV
jgi:hypothetical protein